jgi:hypothetical protein
MTKTEKITLNFVDDDGKIETSVEFEAEPMPGDWAFEPLPVPEPTPDMSKAEGYFLRWIWMEKLCAAEELHPDYRRNEYGAWQRCDPATGRWLPYCTTDSLALVAWLEATYPLKVRALEHDLRAWMREHDFDI